MISMYEFNNQQDDIGYNWKYYDFDNEIYNVDLYINYIIKNQEERYFKLHFLDFYNNNGEKGYPLFEGYPKKYLSRRHCPSYFQI